MERHPQISLESHMDDIHGAATLGGRKQFIKDLSRQLEFKGGDGCKWENRMSTSRD